MTNRQKKVNWVSDIINEGNMYDDLDKKAQKIYDLVSPLMTKISSNRWKKKLDHILKFTKDYGDHEVEYFDNKFLDMMYDICDEEKIWVWF